VRKNIPIGELEKVLLILDRNFSALGNSDHNPVEKGGEKG
jgi:hypothetical protein